MKPQTTKIHRGLFIVLLFSTLIILSVVSLRLGQVDASFSQIFSTLWNHLFDGDNVMTPPRDEETLWIVLTAIRLPRLLLAILSGSALALSGAAMQGLFRNPLADPSLIGVSSGAAMGAISAAFLGIASGHGLLATYGHITMPLFSFLFGIGTTFLVYRIARIDGRTHVATMLLSGIAINALAAAFIGFMLTHSNTTQLRDFIYWTLGRLSEATWPRLLAATPFILIPVIILPFYSRALNAFLLGEAEAGHLGIEIQKVKKLIVFLCAAMVGATVSVCGIIGFIGLVVPHLVRLCIGPDHRYLLPSSILLGSVLLVGSDIVARTAVAPAELPIGIVTALIGAPFFLLLINFSRRDALT